jgi:two-component system heavy metal sensor histidine kinase CusS
MTLGGALLIVARSVNASQRGQFDDALVAQAKKEADAVGRPSGHTVRIGDWPGPAPDDTGHLTRYAAVYDQNGRVLAVTATLAGQPPVLETIRHPLESGFEFFVGGEHVRAVLVSLPEDPGKVLLLAAPCFDLDRDAAFLNHAILLGLAGGACWAAIVTAWVVRQLTRGQEAIAAVARRVAGGDLSARIAESSADREVAQVARDVNQMIDRLAALLSSHQEFIAHAAHELRTPLTSLYGELSQALRRPRDADGYRAAIEEALNSARQLKALAADLLTLARLGASSDQPRETLLAHKIVQDAGRIVADEASERGVVVRVAGECRPIVGHRSDLERLFRNVIENAIRHSPRGGVVEVNVADQTGWAIVAVSDQGRGVSEMDRDRIFEPFYRGAGETADDLPGVGLGLAIARRIARAHSGDVTLSPHGRGGAQFVVRLSG